MRARKLTAISASLLLAAVLFALTWSTVTYSAPAEPRAQQPASISNVALPPASEVQTDVVHITIIHLNDIYEISAAYGGTLGGLSRIATLKQQLLAKNPNTFITFSGDMYSPSALSTAKYLSSEGGDDEPLDGIQVVKVMNEVGLDYMTFGDHEFNTLYGEPFSVATDHFYRNLNESNFKVVSSNVFSTSGEPFTTPNTTVEPNDTFTITNESGASATIGIFGVTKRIRGDKVGISQTELISATEIQVAELTTSGADVIIALTHQPLEDDQEMSGLFSDSIDLILGADDHDPGRSDLTATPPIFKSSSSMEQVYVIDLYYDTATNTIVELTPTLMDITDAIEEDAQTKAVQDEWLEIGFNGFIAEGISATEVIAQAPFDLNGFASAIRYNPTALTWLIAEGFVNTAKADITDTTAYSGHLANYIAGRVRLDDNLPAGNDVLWYDIMRTFPEERGSLTTIAVPEPVLLVSGSFGELLPDTPDAQAGTGRYRLFSSNVTYTEGTWYIDGQPLSPTGTGIYLVTAEKRYNDDIIKNYGATEVAVHTAAARQAMADELRRQEPTAIHISDLATSTSQLAWWSAVLMLAVAGLLVSRWRR